MQAEKPDTITLPELEKSVKKRSQKRPVRIPQFHVVLLDDDEHTYEYVIDMLVQLFRHSEITAFKMACEVDASGKVIVDTTSKERAELKRHQIHAFGPDWRIPHCKGSMSATIEPAGCG